MSQDIINSKRSHVQVAQYLIDSTFNTLSSNIEDLSIKEALFIPNDGYRSILGLLKHIAGWSHIYHSYAFEPNPRQWKDNDWPRGLRDTIDPSREYLDEVILWLHLSQKEWINSLQITNEEKMEEMRSLHWGEKAPLLNIVVMVANHHIYHTGEINYILSISRGEALEEGEEVEENHISTKGHRVKPLWL